MMHCDRTRSEDYAIINLFKWLPPPAYIWAGISLIMLNLAWYAGRRVRKGDSRWARFVLLPVFQAVYVAKLGQAFVLWLVAFLVVYIPPCNADPAWSEALYLLLIINYSIFIFAFWPLTVFLISGSGGMRTMRNGVAIAAVLILLASFVSWSTCRNTIYWDLYYSTVMLPSPRSTVAACF